MLCWLVAMHRTPCTDRLWLETVRYHLLCSYQPNNLALKHFFPALLCCAQSAGQILDVSQWRCLTTVAQVYLRTVLLWTSIRAFDYSARYIHPHFRRERSHTGVSKGLRLPWRIMVSTQSISAEGAHCQVRCRQIFSEAIHLQRSNELLMWNFRSIFAPLKWV